MCRAQPQRTHTPACGKKKRQLENKRAGAAGGARPRRGKAKAKHSLTQPGSQQLSARGGGTGRAAAPGGSRGCSAAAPPASVSAAPAPVVRRRIEAGAAPAPASAIIRPAPTTTPAPTTRGGASRGLVQGAAAAQRVVGGSEGDCVCVCGRERGGDCERGVCGGGRKERGGGVRGRRKQNDTKKAETNGSLGRQRSEKKTHPPAAGGFLPQNPPHRHCAYRTRAPARAGWRGGPWLRGRKAGEKQRVRKRISESECESKGASLFFFTHSLFS